MQEEEAQALGLGHQEVQKEEKALSGVGAGPE
jgi:hypothetical protein